MYSSTEAADEKAVPMTLAEFRRDEERRGLTLATRNGRERTLYQFQRWYLPAPIIEATSSDIDTWLDDCDIGPRSRATYLGTLWAYYEWACRDGRCESNPIEAIRRPRLGRLLPHPIASDDLQRALSAADERMRLWLSLAAFMGLRCIEIAQLRREHVMPESPPRLLVEQGKGGKDRVLPLNLHVERAMTAYGLPASGWLFRLNSGHRLTPGTVSSYINRFLAGLGIRSSAHSCRHFFGTTLYRNTHDIRLTQEMLGHADPKNTAVYVAFDMAAAASAVRTLGLAEP